VKTIEVNFNVTADHMTSNNRTYTKECLENMLARLKKYANRIFVKYGMSTEEDFNGIQMKECAGWANNFYLDEAGTLVCTVVIDDTGEAGQGALKCLNKKPLVRPGFKASSLHEDENGWTIVDEMIMSHVFIDPNDYDLKETE